MSKNVVFLHPDLGVGGAERLVVDAALGLKNNGYNVSFVTSYHNKEHCFQETKYNLDVHVVGEWIPRNIFGRFFALLAYIKMIYCAFHVIFVLKPDIVICDLISVCIPILKLGVKHVIFYCHFPDQLLSKPEGKLKQIYRLPLNWLEEKTTVKADKLYVNSKFTQNVFKKTFSKSLKVVPDILYPSINTKSFEQIQSDSLTDPPVKFDDDDFVFLSINRYEKKKRVALALFALKNLKNELNEDQWKKIKLVIAGGYDLRVTENVEYYNELNYLAVMLDLKNKVTFLKSPSDVDKVWLLRRCDCLIYTPPNEHFGIVPLEAMFCKKPVVACNSGGPTETVVDGQTGFLCQENEKDFSSAMLKLVLDEKLKLKMGEDGCKRFEEKFSFSAFSNQLKTDIENMISNHDKKD